MNILHKNNDSKGAFYIQPEEIQLAEMTYYWSGERETTIDHTEVKEALKGQGAAKRLVEAAVIWARENKVKIVPVCPYAKSTLEKTVEWHDVL